MHIIAWIIFVASCLNIAISLLGLVFVIGDRNIKTSEITSDIVSILCIIFFANYLFGINWSW